MSVPIQLSSAIGAPFELGIAIELLPAPEKERGPRGPVGPVLPEPPDGPVGPVEPVSPIAADKLIIQLAIAEVPEMYVTSPTKEVPEYDVTCNKKYSPA
tara:strand:+ start:66 stop:362 length:297 start_codon:yes stop_codon:yes gene_type:complete